ncbi:MAG: hypothetical protein GY715_08930 [Planctomycetes bacterium]|nr:hypothetical protein [Planctomycetota bacterium]
MNLPTRSALRAFVPSCLSVLLAACSADVPLNPSFPLTLADAKGELREMRADPRSLERPVVVLGGIHDPGFIAPGLAREVKKLTTPDAPVIAVSFLTASDFETCRRRVIDAVDRAFPSDDPAATVEVDAIGVSMGGIVARYAARPRTDGGRRLRVRRLFTIGSPHLGARMADLPTFDSRILDMRRGSTLLAALNDHAVDEDPEVYPYTRLGDSIVGAEHTAPPGRPAWWVQNVPFAFAHLAASHDARFLADIMRRLRGEPAYATEPAAPLPGDGGSTGTPDLP